MFDEIEESECYDDDTKENFEEIAKVREQKGGSVWTDCYENRKRNGKKRGRKV